MLESRFLQLQKIIRLMPPQQSEKGMGSFGVLCFQNFYILFEKYLEKHKVLFYYEYLIKERKRCTLFFCRNEDLFVGLLFVLLKQKEFEK